MVIKNLINLPQAVRKKYGGSVKIIMFGKLASTPEPKEQVAKNVGMVEDFIIKFYEIKI